MKKIINIISSFLIGVLVLSSCTPDKYSLGSTDIKSSDLVEGIAFTITYDADNQNIVYLTSLLDDPQHPISWIHPQGASREKVVELRIAFEGTYDVLFGVQTSAGLVYGDTVQFTINQFYPDFVSDEMWTNLTGGVGNSKTWIFDNGKYGLASGEVGYANPEDVVEYNNFNTNWEPGAGQTGDDNIWSSYMTFSINDGAFIETHNEGWKDESGEFMMDVNNKTLTFTNVDLIHPEGWDNMTPNWSRNLKILTLSENQLQVAILRDPSTSGDSEWWLIWNYVSKEYADNYVQEEQDPPYDGDANDDLTTSTQTTKQWIINLDAPYNWAQLNGEMMNEWTIASNGIPEFVGWAPPYDETLLSTISITLSKGDGNSGTYEIINSEGQEFTGNYIIDAKNWIDFGQDIDIISGMDWVSFSTMDGKLRIISVERTVSGTVSVLNLGVIDPDNDQQYKTIALVQGNTVGGGDDNGLNGTVLSFDNSKLVYGHIEDDTDKFRIELYNIYGATANDPGLNTNVDFESTVQVTFTLSGLSFKNGAAGRYPAGIQITADGWWPSYSGDGTGAGDVMITGNGTYTVWCSPGAIESVIVFNIDIMDIIPDIVDISQVTATIDKIEVK